ncbi:MAG: hypothetical protein QM723_07025 [Myxococcaceae bacterium]
MKTLFLAVSLVVGQSRTVVIDTPDVDPKIAGAFVAPLSDGGCTLQVSYAPGGVGDAGLMPSSQPYAFNGGRCNVARIAIQQAAYRDFRSWGRRCAVSGRSVVEWGVTIGGVVVGVVIIIASYKHGVGK